MVLRKKGVTPSKKVQGKKAFEVDNDSDFDGDSSEEMVVQKTPKNKTPQVRNSQSVSARKVSFELSGKKTPGKTPQKNSSFVGKEQPIPVAKGMKGNKGVQKKEPQSEEMDDDDDDEDDDDFELDMDEDNDDDFELDMDEDNDDDFELDMDSDSDDGEEEDDEEEQIQKRKSNSKQLKNVTPMKGADKSKELLPKGKIPRNEIKGKSNSIEPLGKEMEEEDDCDLEFDMDDIDDEDEEDEDEEDEDEEDEDEDEEDEDEEQEQIRKQKSNSKQKISIKGAESKEPQTLEAKSQENGKKYMSKGERDSVSLFIGNLPSGVTPGELRALSSDITDVFIPRNFRRFAFIRFASEEKTDANYKILQGKKLNGFLLNIDYLGAKSKNKFDPKIKEEQQLKSLYVGNLPIDVTSDELKALSSDIQDVFLVKNSNSIHCKSAFLKFASEEKADANYKTLQGIKLKDQVLKIDYAGKKSLKSIPSFKASKLYISGIPLSVTLGDVATHFPKASLVAFNGSTVPRTAFVNFFNEEDAVKAYSLKEIEINGHMLKIDIHDSSSDSSRKREGIWKRNVKREVRPAKRRKF